MPNLRLHQCGLLLAAGLLAPTDGFLRGQAAEGSPPAAVVRWSDARRVGATALAAAAVMPADRWMQRTMQRAWVQESPLLAHSADAFNAFGSPGVVIGSAALYAAGWASGRRDVARLGLRTGEAIIASGVVTGALKGMAGRARPYASPQRPGDWRLFSGTRDGARQSFPSGHTTAAFAFASAMHRELRVSHPQTASWAGPALYAAAALTGLARLHADRHWASDVVMGAGIGTVTGLVVARFHADRPSHWIDRRLLPRAR